MLSRLQLYTRVAELRKHAELDAIHDLSLIVSKEAESRGYGKGRSPLVKVGIFN